MVIPCSSVGYLKNTQYPTRNISIILFSTPYHPSIALADLVKDIKVASSIMIKEENLFPNFKAWQIGYAAFTYSQDAKQNLINYVKNQEKHHQTEEYLTELKKSLKEQNIEYDEKYLL